MFLNKKYLEQRLNCSFIERKDKYNLSPKDLFRAFFPLIDTTVVSLKDRMDQFLNHKSKWGFLFDLKHLPEKEELGE